MRANLVDSVVVADRADGDGLREVREEVPDVRADCDPRGDAGGVGYRVPPGVRGLVPPVRFVTPPA